MPHEDEVILRNALDAVDRGRRLAMVGVAALLVATAFVLFVLFHLAGGPPPSGPALTLKAVFASAVSVMLLVACCTAVLMIHVTRMAKSILRAIDGTKAR
jgi:hypothetical protein